MIANNIHIKKNDKQIEALGSDKGKNANGRLQSKNHPSIYVANITMPNPQSTGCKIAVA